MPDDTHIPKSPAPGPLAGPNVDGFSIVEWCPTHDASGPAEAVAIVFNVRQLGDIVLRLRSRRAVEETIAALQKHADSVFGADKS